MPLARLAPHRAGDRRAGLGQDRDARPPRLRRRLDERLAGRSCIDAKGDPDTQLRFAAQHAPRRSRPCGCSRRSPTTRGAGTGREIANRLVALIDWADEGGGAYYRDLSTNLVRLACTAPDGPPRSLARAARAAGQDRLLMLWAGRREAQRGRALPRRAHRRLPPALPLVLRRHRRPARRRRGRSRTPTAPTCCSTSCSTPRRRPRSARFLIEDFKQYLAGRNPDRPPGAADRSTSSPRSPTANARRGWSRSCAATAPPSSSPRSRFDGMGGPEAAARILNAAHTVILHAVPDPEPIIKAAGTKMATEWSLQHERGLSTDVGSTRTQHQMRVDPNEVRRLTPGMCIAIGGGKRREAPDRARATRRATTERREHLRRARLGRAHDEPEPERTHRCGYDRRATSCSPPTTSPTSCASRAPGSTPRRAATRSRTYASAATSATAVARSRHGCAQSSAGRRSARDDARHGQALVRNRLALRSRRRRGARGVVRPVARRRRARQAQARPEAPRGRADRDDQGAGRGGAAPAHRG